MSMGVRKREDAGELCRVVNRPIAPLASGRRDSYGGRDGGHSDVPARSLSQGRPGQRRTPNAHGYRDHRVRQRQLEHDSGPGRIVWRRTHDVRPLRENIGLHGNLTRCLHLGSAPYVVGTARSTTRCIPRISRRSSHYSSDIPRRRRPRRSGLHRSRGHDLSPSTSDVAGRPLRDGTGVHRPFMDAGTRICVSSAVVRRSAVARSAMTNGMVPLATWASGLESRLMGLRVHRRAALDVPRSCGGGQQPDWLYEIATKV